KGSTEYPGPIGLHGPYSGMFAALDFLDAARLLTKKVARITILQLSFSSGLSDIAAPVMRLYVHCDPNSFPPKFRAIQICLQCRAHLGDRGCAPGADLVKAGDPPPAGTSYSTIDNPSAVGVSDDTPARVRD